MDIDMFFKCATLLLGIAALLYARFQLKANHDWNRRKAAQDILRERSTLDIKKLNETFNIHNRKDAIPLDEINEAFKKDIFLKGTLNKYLNFYESLARGMEYHIYDEDVIKSGSRKVMIQNFMRYENYIKDVRIKNGDKRAWGSFEDYVNKWLNTKNTKRIKPTA